MNYKYKIREIPVGTAGHKTTLILIFPRFCISFKKNLKMK